MKETSNLRCLNFLKNYYVMIKIWNVYVCQTDSLSFHSFHLKFNTIKVCMYFLCWCSTLTNMLENKKTSTWTSCLSAVRWTIGFFFISPQKSKIKFIQSVYVVSSFYVFVSHVGSIKIINHGFISTSTYSSTLISLPTSKNFGKLIFMFFFT